MNENKKPKYGVRDASFQAAGDEAGIRALVDAFYDLMSTDARFEPIYAMHPEDNQLSREKLAKFLCGWLGGPKRYQEKFGAISIPKVHAHLPIAAPERDLWLECMLEAINGQPYAEEFRNYLIAQLGVPAEHVRRRCSKSP